MPRGLSPGYISINVPQPTARLRLQTLGGPGVWLGSTPLSGTASRRRLVAFLALVAAHRARGVTRDKLLAYLWPESDTTHARNSLKQVLFWVRRVLKAPQLIVASGDVLRLDPAHIQVDAWEFESALERGSLREAVACYQGPYLDGFHLAGVPEFEQWSDGERSRLARCYLDALDALAQAAEQSGDTQSAIAWRRRLAEADPLSTARALGLMQALIAAGDPTGALEHFRAHTALVRAELECPPSAELVELAERIHRGDSPPAAVRRLRWSAESPPIAYAARDLATAVVGPPHDVVGPTTVLPARVSARPQLRRWLSAALGAVLFAAADGGSIRSPDVRTNSVGLELPFTVLPFAVTGSPEFADLAVGLQDLIAARLDGVGPLHRVAGSTAWPQRRIQAAAPLDPAAGATVARRMSARLYAMGQIIADSAGLEATATVYDRGNANAQVARAEARAHLGSVFDLADDLASQLIGQIYVGPDQRLVRVAATSTRSLPALKAYVEGQRLLRGDSLGGAMDAFRRAVRADSTFSLAYYRLSVAAELAEEPGVAVWAAQLAARFSAGLSDYERELVQAYLVYRRGRLDEAERLYRRIIAEHPTDPEGWSRLADLLFHSNPLRGRSVTEAREPLTRLLALTPDDPAALIDLARVAALEERPDEADTLVRRAVSLTGDPSRLDHHAFRAFSLGDPAEAHAVRDLLSRAGVVPPRLSLAVTVYLGDLQSTEYVALRLTNPAQPCELRSIGHRLLAQVETAKGRPQRAFAALREAESCGAAAALEQRAAYAVLPFLPLDTVEGMAVREELEQTAGVDSTARAYATGLLALRLGDTLGAHRALAWLAGIGGSSPVDARTKALARSLGARLAAAQGRLRLALARLESADWEQGGGPMPEAADRFLRAQLLQAVGREDEALGWYGSIAQRSSDELV